MKTDVWRRRFAPRFKRAKLDSGLSEREISRRFNRLCDRKAGRAQINHFCTGTRVPTVNQFMVLCKIIRADPVNMLFPPKRRNAHGTATSEAQA